MSHGREDALKATTLCSLLLYIKFFLSLMLQGKARFAAGSRPPEDESFGVPGASKQVFNSSESDSPAEAKELEQRWLRIISNDLESIPFGLIIAWGSMFSVDEDSATAHTILISVYTVMRYAHTYCYANSIQPWRTHVWFIGTLCIIAMGVNATIKVFD